MPGENTVVDIQPVRLATRRVTRAHVAIGSARRFAQALQQSVDRIAQVLSKELGRAVAIQAHLLASVSRGREALADPAVFAQFDLGAMGSAALLELETPVAGAFVDALAGGPASSSAPYAMSTAERAAIGFLCLLVVRTIREDVLLDSQVGPRFVRVAEGLGEAAGVASALGNCVAVELKLKVAECSGLGRLLVPAASLGALCHAMPAEVGRPLRIRADVPMAVIAHPLVLDPADVASLALGDVVMVPEAGIGGGLYQGGAQLQTDAFRLEGSFGPKGFTVHALRTHALAEEVMAQNNIPGQANGPRAPNVAAAPAGLRPPNGPLGGPAAKPPPPPAAAKVPGPAQPTAPTPATPAVAKPLAPLPVEIEVELTRINVSLADLANVEPGAILPLHIAATAGVVLRIGDKLIARAELVDIEGELGARITEVAT